VTPLKKITIFELWAGNWVTILRYYDNFVSRKIFFYLFLITKYKKICSGTTKMNIFFIFSLIQFNFFSFCFSLLFFPFSDMYSFPARLVYATQQDIILYLLFWYIIFHRKINLWTHFVLFVKHMWIKIDLKSPPESKLKGHEGKVLLKHNLLRCVTNSSPDVTMENLIDLTIEW